MDASHRPLTGWDPSSNEIRQPFTQKKIQKNTCHSHVLKRFNASNILLQRARCGSQDGCGWNSWVLFLNFQLLFFFSEWSRGMGDKFYCIKVDKNGIRIHLEVPLIWTPKNDVVFRKYCGKKSCQILDTMKKCLVCLRNFCFWLSFWSSSGILLEWNDFHLPEFSFFVQEFLFLNLSTSTKKQFGFPFFFVRIFEKFCFRSLIFFCNCNQR